MFIYKTINLRELRGYLGWGTP